MRRPVTLTAAVAATALTLAACGGGSEPEGDDGATAEQAQEEATPAGDQLPTVTETFGETPTIEFPGTGAPEELRVEVLEEGDGAEVGAEDYVMADYVGQVWDGEIFDSSFERGEPTGFSLTQVIPGWQQGLTGTHVGDRVLLSIPPDLGYPEGTPDGSVAPGDTLVFVVDVHNAVAPDAAAPADAEPVEPTPDLPVTVQGELGEPVTISVDEGAEEPTEHRAELVAAGSGEEVPAEGARLYLHYAASMWDNSVAESTWDAGIPLVYVTPTDTYFDQLVGMPEGSRVVLLVAAEEDTTAMAAVVDIIDVVPGAQTE